MAHQLQRAALEPPGDCGQRAGVRPGANPAGRGVALPAAEQPETQHHQPEGDQSEAADVAGTPITSTQLPEQPVVVAVCAGRLQKRLSECH